MSRKLKPGSKEWKARVAEVMREELAQPEQWHWVSFADEVFRGAVVIQAHGVTDAATKCHALNINPGGQVMALPMPPEILAQVPESYRNRLLTKAEVKELWPDAKSLREYEEEEANVQRLQR
jgi:hypothetical protein